VGSTKLSLKPQERSSKVELLTIDSMFRNYAISKCVLMRINRTSNCTTRLLHWYDVGTLGNEGIFAKYLKK